MRPLRPLAATLLPLGALLAAPDARAQRPNVVVVITDDQGYGDLAAHGNPILKTPHLDALHAVSVRLTDYHVAPTCSPTRAAFQTGRWTSRTGVWHTIMGRSMLREDEVSLGQVFEDSGYATGLFGKWHLGDNHPFRPEDRGYEEVLRHGGGGVGQTPDYWDNAYFDGHYWHNGAPVPVKGFCTDVFFEYARRFMEKQKGSGRPFLALISTNAPHGPMHSPVEFSRPYAEVGDVALQNFYGMIANIDWNVGRLQSFLESEGLAENTVLVFTTDNGSSHGWRTFNAGMREGKGSEYDGGHRVPFFLHWPKGGLTGGRDVEVLTAHVDVLPTLADLCGVPLPEGVRLDGTSLVPLLHGSVGDWPDRILVTDSQRVKDPIKWRKSAVMTSQWRLVNGEELYEIRSDPGQESDVAQTHPDVVGRLRAFYDAWWEELEPTFAREAAISLGHPAENPARLTSHDWITTAMTPWNQAQIRSAMTGAENTGFWNVEVVEAGEYEIRLRRWPEETGAALDATLEPGSPVPGERAFRVTPGQRIRPVAATLRIGDVSARADVTPGAQDVVFELSLPAGRARMTARFLTAEGQQYGAYYAYVRRK